MRSLFRSAVVLVACSAFAAAAPDAPPTLKVGDPAPPLTVGSWPKGDPVGKLEPGKRYVLEFWATWCAPCVATMPHLSALQKQYPDVVFIAQDVLEDDVADVKPFVARNADRMGFRVATDDVTKAPDGAMNAAWLKASGHETLPATFVVDGGRIIWIGDPSGLADVLARLAVGTSGPKSVPPAATPAK